MSVKVCWVDDLEAAEAIVIAGADEVMKICSRNGLICDRHTIERYFMFQNHLLVNQQTIDMLNTYNTNTFRGNIDMFATVGAISGP